MQFHLLTRVMAYNSSSWFFFGKLHFRVAKVEKFDIKNVCFGLGCRVRSTVRKSFRPHFHIASYAYDAHNLVKHKRNIAIFVLGVQAIQYKENLL